MAFIKNTVDLQPQRLRQMLLQDIQTNKCNYIVHHLECRWHNFHNIALSTSRVQVYILWYLPWTDHLLGHPTDHLFHGTVTKGMRCIVLALGKKKRHMDIIWIGFQGEFAWRSSQHIKDLNNGFMAAKWRQNQHLRFFRIVCDVSSVLSVCFPPAGSSSLNWAA